MNLSVYLGLQHDAEATLADAFRLVSEGHSSEADVHVLCQRHAATCDEHVTRLKPLTERYGQHEESEPERMRAEGLTTARSGPVGLLRDLQDLYLLATFSDITWSMLLQAGHALRDDDLLDTVGVCEPQTAAQLRWLRTRMSVTAPQALIAAE
ncbi:hypothetical protein FB566_4419 [Stackebrandtia endophytica]|uniref:DUF892 family protein n=1 Tax=Stackebrandtia endophytica TaxID=1496996 RepID=A0A543B1X2_9ACTN|nr:hypothetical protein [Stackebrandtia endophytica]TQL78824.1 hypothetical protein FB566_4419 [Stackebrandtia endophytica]